jgi:hypothetical protein
VSDTDPFDADTGRWSVDWFDPELDEPPEHHHHEVHDDLVDYTDGEEVRQS